MRYISRRGSGRLYESGGDSWMDKDPDYGIAFVQRKGSPYIEPVYISSSPYQGNPSNGEKPGRWIPVYSLGVYWTNTGKSVDNWVDVLRDGDEVADYSDRFIEMPSRSSNSGQKGYIMDDDSDEEFEWVTPIYKASNVGEYVIEAMLNLWQEMIPSRATFHT